MTKYVLSVDPGKATGVVLMSLDGETPVKVLSSELQPEEFAPYLKPILEGWKLHESFIVVCERFTINAQTVRNSQAPYSLEQIGVLKHLCREAGYSVDDIVMQSPADAKAMFPNEALKKVGTWHVGGEGHANDAMRHALLRLVKTGWKPRVLLD
jgi:DNA-binding transcriptional regulator PaaX